MKLQELDARRPKEQSAKVLESHLGSKIDFRRINPKKAQTMLVRVQGLLREHRAGPNRHFSERNPDYLKLIMVEQALLDVLAEVGMENMIAVDLKDPQTQAIMKKAQSGQTLNPDEQKTVTAIASMKKEAKKMRRMVKESEIQTAQVVMAAQDMVDRVQKMLEQISEMQFKDLPALADAIKNDMGVDQATKFQADAAAALTNLLASVQSGKTQLEAAQGVLTGQAPTVPGDTSLEPAAAAPAAEPTGDELGLDANLPSEEDEEEDEELSAVSLGRERR